MAVLSAAASMANCLGRITAGVLSDRLSFQVVLVLRAGGNVNFQLVETSACTLMAALMLTWRTTTIMGDFAQTGFAIWVDLHETADRAHLSTFVTIRDANGSGSIAHMNKSTF